MLFDTNEYLRLLTPQNVVIFLVDIVIGMVMLQSALALWVNIQNRKLPDGVIRPPHLRSYIPYIGSAMRLVSGNTREFILQTAKSLNSPVFTALIAGTKCVFIADPDLVFVVFKDSIKGIDSLSLQKKAMISISGIPKDVVEENFRNVKLAKELMGQIHKYLIHTDHLTKSVKEVQKIIDQNLNEAIEKSAERKLEGESEWVSYSMFKFVRKVIFYASVGPIISTGLTEESIVDDFTTFDDGLAYLFADAPSFLTKNAVAARERLIQALMEKKVHEGFSDFFHARNKSLGQDPAYFARVNVGVFIATVSNSIPAVFWVLFHILTDDKARKACVETVQKVASEQKGEYFSLEDLDKMPVLQSCFLEALRIYQSFFVTRDVNEDFIVNPKGSPKFLLEKGSRIMAYPQTVHMDPEIFEDPEVFKYDRFLDEKELSKNGKLLINQLRPFGGGAHLCPGRKFIGYETRAFLAMMLLRLDMKLDDDMKKKPGIQLHRQGFSVAHPDHDPIFQVKAREESSEN